MKIVNPFEPGKKQYYGRYLKPSFRYQSTKSIVVPAGANNPALFIIGGVAMQRTQSLECNLTINGPGGLLTGSLAASSVYYLYAITYRDDVALIADTSPPSVGLTGYDDWTYLGAFVTTTTSTIPAFVSCLGTYHLDDRIVTTSSTSSTTLTPVTISPYPITPKFHWGSIEVNGTVVNAFGSAAGDGTVTNNDTVYQYLQVNGVAARNGGIVPCLVPKTIYLRVSNAANSAVWRAAGWIEDPSEYL